MINNCFSECTCRCITIIVLKKLPFSSYSHLKDWKVEWREGVLAFYCLSSTLEDGLHVTFSVSVNTDFSYSLSFRGQPVISLGCTALREISTTVVSLTLFPSLSFIKCFFSLVFLYIHVCLVAGRRIPAVSGSMGDQCVAARQVFLQREGKHAAECRNKTWTHCHW